MAGLKVRQVSKAFGSTAVLDAVDFAMAEREFLAFLGPSGSGKSTLLRIIAGLETADSGTIELAGKRIDQLPPGERNVAMVFQHYALYPHMSVRDNMAFGLRNAGVARTEIDAAIAEAARILEIEPLLARKPGQLSGGQRQRVAIGRAIVKRPQLFLLDEPLSNLDAALRSRTRVELAQLRQRIDAGIIIVTHDQVEAMTLADRIIVMNDRQVQQIGTPMDIYTRPANRFVAQFVGSPAMAMIPASVADVAAGGITVVLAGGTQVATAVPAGTFRVGDTVTLGVRAEMAKPMAPANGAVAAEVMLVERLGDRTLIFAQLGDGSEITAEDSGQSNVRIGDRLALGIDGARVHLFDANGTAHHAAQVAASVAA